MIANSLHPNLLFPGNYYSWYFIFVHTTLKRNAVNSDLSTLIRHLDPQKQDLPAVNILFKDMSIPEFKTDAAIISSCKQLFWFHNIVPEFQHMQV